MAQSTTRTRRGKSSTFPLTLHKPTGQYRKRIRGKDFYFGTARSSKNCSRPKASTPAKSMG